MENLDLEYNELRQRFLAYKEEANNEIKKLKKENKNLGKSLAVLFNIVEISGYVNSFISQDNLVGLINDMIIGVLGAAKSTIYLMEDKTMVVKASNDVEWNSDREIKYEEYLYSGQPCVINIIETKNNNSEISSILGIPISMGKKIIGYIVAEHTLYKFFNNEHKMFLGAIANQIAIAIENSRLYKELQKSAQIDPLLNVYNRRTFFDIVEQKLTIKDYKDYAIVMLDFDDFKHINDTLGHQFGDEVLIQTTNVIKQYLLKEDIIARYGGEEIIIFIDDAKNKKDVYKSIDNIRSGIENNIIIKDDKLIKITSSFGISFSVENGAGLEENIHIADKLLYKAKYNGKNRVISSHL